MFSAVALADLAADAAFRHDVQQLGRRLLASPATIDRAWVSALASYGPQRSGVALRLVHLDHAVNVDALDQTTAQAWAALLPRVQATHA